MPTVSGRPGAHSGRGGALRGGSAGLRPDSARTSSGPDLRWQKLSSGSVTSGPHSSERARTVGVTPPASEVVKT